MTVEKSRLIYEPNALSKYNVFSIESHKTKMRLYESKLSNLREQMGILERIGNSSDVNPHLENLSNNSCINEFTTENNELVKLNNFNLESLKRRYILKQKTQ